MLLSDVLCCHPAGVSLDLSQPAAALQSQKAQTSAQPFIQTQTIANQAAAPQKQVQTVIQENFYFFPVK